MMKSDYIKESSAPDERREREISLLCTAAQLILENGGETYRVEETVLRMAAGFGLYDVNVAAFTTSIFVEVGGRMRICRIKRRGTNLTRIERTNDISRRVAQGQMTLDEAEAALTAIKRYPGTPQRVLIPAFGLAAGSFSLLFTGGVIDFAVAFVIGMFVQLIQPLFSRMEMSGLFGNFFGGLITSVGAVAASMIIPGFSNVNATIVGGIMPLLTGLLMTTAMRDTMYGDLISGIARALEALLLAVAVALGVYVGLSFTVLMGGTMP